MGPHSFQPRFPAEERGTGHKSGGSHNFHIIHPHSSFSHVPEEQVSHGQGILFAISDNTVQVILKVIHPGHLASVNIIFRGRDPEEGTQEGKGGIMFIIPEFP